MKILYGTGNPAKLSSMKHRLEKLNIELIGLNDIKEKGIEIPEVPEDGNTPLENARQKATAYYEAFHIPVFSCDSGLYFDNVPDEVQPGVHVRTVNGSYLSDEQMIEYYSGLAKQYGNLTARYKNAICFVMDENHTYEAMEPSMESEKFIITDTPHSSIRKKGFPLDSLSIDIKTNKYYYDLPTDRLEQVAVEDGFLMFFQEVLGKDSIYTRRSIRKYTKEPISKFIIEQIIDAGRVAPSAKNRQPWKYLVYSGKAKDRLLGIMRKGIETEEISPRLPLSVSGIPDAKNTLRIMENAPVVIIVLNMNGKSPFSQLNADERFTEINDLISIGTSIENMLLKAEELNIGTLCIGNTCFAYRELIEYIGMDAELVGAVALGYKAEEPPMRPRKRMDDIVEYFE